jgi:hypothetical protein
MNLFEPQSGQIGQARTGSNIIHKKFSIKLEKHYVIDNINKLLLIANNS